MSSQKRSKSVTCPACGELRTPGRFLAGELLPPRVAAVLQNEHPGWRPTQSACPHCVNQAKAGHMEQLLVESVGALSAPEEAVLQSIRDEAILSENMDDGDRESTSSTEQLANDVAGFVGSWRFAGLILGGIVIWIIINVVWRPFSPFPTILLAGVSATLASLAAVEGPIILMAQRRQRQQDRRQAENEYKVNLKAELEIRYLDEKIDHLLRLHHGRDHRQSDENQSTSRSLSTGDSDA